MGSPTYLKCGTRASSEENAILELAQVAHDYAVTAERVFPHLATAANLAVFTRSMPVLSKRRPAQLPFLGR